MPSNPRPPSPAYAAIYAVVRRIPRGRVLSYGGVARLAGLGPRARQVGYALFALPDDTTLPWHRVVDAAGRVKARATPGADALQVALLRREGVVFDPRGCIELARFAWKGDGRPAASRRPPAAKAPPAAPRPGRPPAPPSGASGRAGRGKGKRQRKG